jgi:hypothetical protein
MTDKSSLEDDLNAALDPENLFDAHARLIGFVTINWNDCHDLVYHIFEDTSGLGEPMARALFHTLRSDAGQRELTLAAARVALEKDETRFKSLKLIFNRIGGLAAVRNEAMHTSWGMNFLIDESGENLEVSGIGKRPRHPPTEEDDKFTERFQALRRDLQQAYEDLHDWWKKPSPQTDR